MSSTDSSGSGEFVVYGEPTLYPQFVIATAHERSFPIKVIPILIGKQENKSAAYLAKHPFGQTPVAEYNGSTVYESRAIAEWIDELATEGNKLTPSDINQRALMRQWLYLNSGTFALQAQQIIFQRLILGFRGIQLDEALIKQVSQKLETTLDVLEAKLSKSSYLCGSEFTLADLSYLPFLNALSVTPEKVLLESRPALLAWFNLNASRPSWVYTRGLIKEWIANLRLSKP